MKFDVLTRLKSDFYEEWETVEIHETRGKRRDALNHFIKTFAIYTSLRIVIVVILSAFLFISWCFGFIEKKTKQKKLKAN